MQHSLHNYNYNQRNPDSRNVSGNKSKETSRSADYGPTKPPAVKPTSNEKAHDHSSSVEKSEQDKSQSNSKSMPVLNEKAFASKCTISDSVPPATAPKDRPPATAELPRAKDESKEKEPSASSSTKTSKNNSTESETTPASSQPANQEETGSASVTSSLNLNKSTISQAKPASTYPTSIQHQQSTSSSSSQMQTPPPLSSSSISSKFSGTPVPNRVFVGGISTDTTEAELQALFSQFGIIKAVKIIIDREGIPKGYGFITYTTEEEANKVLKESDNLVLKNRKLNVAIAVKKQPSNPNLSSSGNLTRNFDLNQYFQNGNIPFYMPNGLSSIPAYMNEYGPISFGPDALYASVSYPSPLAGLPHSNPAFAHYPLVYRPSSLYFPSSTVSMHPPHQNASHPGSSNPNAGHLPLNHPSMVQSPVNLQQQSAGNAQDQYSSQQTSIQSHSNQPQSNQQSAQASHHHHPPSRLGGNPSGNNPNSSQMGGQGGGGGGGPGNQPDGGGGYQSQYHSHLHHLNPSGGGGQGGQGGGGGGGQGGQGGQHHGGSHHPHIHHSHQPSHAQSSNLVSSNTSNANQQHTPAQPVFISNTGLPQLPYIHPLHSLQYNPVGLAGQPPYGPNTTQPHQTSMNQPHYAHNLHNPMSSQHSQVNQYPMNPLNPNWVNNSQWR